MAARPTAQPVTDANVLRGNDTRHGNPLRFDIGEARGSSQALPQVCRVRFLIQLGQPNISKAGKDEVLVGAFPTIHRIGQFRICVRNLAHHVIGIL